MDASRVHFIDTHAGKVNSSAANFFRWFTFTSIVASVIRSFHAGHGIGMVVEGRRHF